MTASATTEYNPFDPEFYPRHAFETYRWLRDESPVWRSPRWGWYALTRFEDVRAALLDPDLYRSFEGMDIDNTFSEQMASGGSLGNIDNPRHDEIRAIVQPWFLPRRVGAHEDAIRKAVREHIATWRERGSVDIAQELAWPTPFDAFFSLMGIPHKDRADRDQLERWTHELKGRVPGTPDFTPVALEADSRIRAYFINLLQDRRTNPQNDVISTIVHAKINGVPFTDEHIEPAAEVMGLMVILYLGGVESTAGLIGSTFKLLAENPDQRRLLLDDASLIPAAVEESVRWVTPLQLTARTVMRDVTLHGVTIPARSRVVLIVGAANRDERQFPDPDRFDVARGVVKHVGFGEGVHGCLGAPLARLEAKIVLQEALPVLGEYELAGEPVFYPSSPNMYVWWNLPVRFSTTGGR
jgi:cytochrome P450